MLRRGRAGRAGDVGVGAPGVQRAWPVVLRTQILLTSATLSLAAAWRLTSAGELLGPIALAAGLWVLLGAPWRPWSDAEQGGRAAP